MRLLEEIVEGRAGARRRRRRGLALDRGTGFELVTCVAGVLGRDADRDRLLAFERRAGVEVHALRAGVQVSAAACAAALHVPRERHRQLVAAWRAADHLAEARHVGRLGREWWLAARRELLLLHGTPLTARRPRLVLVSALTVLAI